MPRTTRVDTRVTAVLPRHRGDCTRTPDRRTAAVDGRSTNGDRTCGGPVCDVTALLCPAAAAAAAAPAVGVLLLVPVVANRGVQTPHCRTRIRRGLTVGHVTEINVVSH